MTDFEANFNFENREPIELEATIEPRQEVEAQFIINAHTAVATWGNITGLLSNQEDLQNALDDKANKSTTVNGYPLSDNISLKTSDLNNDSGYITLEDISAYDTTGLSYDNTTGVISLGEGYQIPLSSDLDTYITKDVDNLTYYRKSTTQDIVDNELSTRISDEVTARTNADTQLSNRINTESTTRRNADDVLQQNIDAETLARSNADTLLSNRISSNQQAIATEAQRRISADSILQNNIDAEIADREASESNLSDRIDTNEENISAEVIARTNAINALNETISQEVLDRASGDGTLQEEINDLSSNLTSHIEDTDNPHNVTKAQIGLSNVDNTSDLNKPISTAVQNALNQKATTSSIQSLTDRVEDIEEVIPTEATTSNKLADENYVDTSIGKGNLTIQKNNANIGIFNANSSVNKIINIEVPTKISDLNNDVGFIDLTDISSGSEALTYNNETGVISITPGYSITTSIQRNQITVNANDISDIQDLIPNQASSSNQLADKDFVNSTIQTGTANFRGNWANWADVPIYPSEYPEDYSGSRTPDTNDYLVIEDSSDYAPLYSNTRPYPKDFCVYYNDTMYKALIDINVPENFDSTKWEEVTKGNYIGTWRFKYVGVWSSVAREGWKPEYRVNEEPFTINQWKAINSGVTSDDVILIHSAIQPGDNVSELVNDAEYIDKDVNNLTYYTTTSDLTTLLADKQDVISDLETIRSGASAGATAVQPEDLATVATTGSYTDLTNKPEINNGTLTIQANGTTVATFTSNQSTDTTANITIPDSATWGNISGTLSNQTDLQTALNGKADKIEAVSSGGSLGQVFVKKSNEDYDVEWQSADDLRMFNKDVFTVVGSPTITDDGVVLSQQNGTMVSTIEFDTITMADDFDIISPVVKIVNVNNIDRELYFWNDNTNTFRMSLNPDGRIAFRYLDSNDGAKRLYTPDLNIQNGDSYQIKISKRSGTIQLYYKKNGSEWLEGDATVDFLTTPTIVMFRTKQSSNDNYAITTEAELDLKYTSVIIDNQVVFNGSTTLSNRLADKVNNSSQAVINALGYTPYNSTNPSGYQANILEGVQVNGTDLSITNKKVNVIVPTQPSDIGAQTELVSGISIKTINNTSLLGSGDITINPSPDLDGITISKNTNDKLQAIGVIDQNNTTNALKYWTGTQAQYNAIVTKDSNTLYNITDDGLYKTINNLGQIIPSILPLNDTSLHLLDGTLIRGGGIYSDFVNYIANLKNNSTHKYSNITKIGPLSDQEGLLSGFTNTPAYAKLPIVFNPIGNTWEMVFKFKTSSTMGVEQFIFSSQVGLSVAERFGIRIYINSSNKLCFSDSTDGSTWINATGTTTLTTNTNYWAKLIFNGTSRILYLSTNGTTYTQEATVSDSNSSANFTYSAIGAWNSSSWGTNTLEYIDLNESYININGQRWWTGRMPVGFTDEPQWQETVIKYGSCGRFVYNETDNTVRLPKISGFIEGTIDKTYLGELIEAGLPNITGAFNLGANGINSGSLGYCGGSGAFSGTETTSATFVATRNSSASSTNRSWDFDASRSSFVYGNSTTVQPQSIKVLYYIVIATLIKPPVVVDMDDVATDLNSKADTDLTNTIEVLSTSSKDYFSSAGLPSNTYDVLTLGASGSSYTAPANGWFSLGGNDAENVNARYVMRKSDLRFGVSSNTNNSTVSSGWMAGVLPVKKGDVINVFYQNVTSAGLLFLFLYAEGEL